MQTPGKPKIKLSTEHQNFAWIKESELGQYNLSKETKEAISKAFSLEPLSSNL